MNPVPQFDTCCDKRRRLMQALASLPITLPVAGLTGCGGGDGGSPTNTPATVVDRRMPLATGVTLHVRDWNPFNSDRVIVLLAGLGGNAQGFNGLAAELSKRARVLAVTRRGYGRSDKPLPSAGNRYDTATLVGDLEALLLTLRIDRIILCGHSIAGNELTLFAGRRPQRVKGLVYLDTTYDYTRPDPDLGEPIPDNPALTEPAPTPADYASIDAIIAYSKRMNRNWFAPMEANLRDAIVVQRDGSIADATPSAVAESMRDEGHAFKPDYRAVRAPALIFAAIPGDTRDLFPWLPAQVDAATKRDADTLLRLVQRGRRDDAALLASALPGSRRIDIANSAHADFFIAYQATVVQAIESAYWY